MDGFDTEQKRKRPFKTLFKILLFGASIAVYLIFFVRFFVSCDADIADDVFLDKASAEKFCDLENDLHFYHYQPLSWTNEDGSVQLSNIFYIEDFKNLQLTVRSRDDIFNKDSDAYPFTFEIRVSGDEEKTVVPTVRVENRYGYTYARLEVRDVLCAQGEEVLFEVTTFDENGNSVVTQDSEIKGGTEVHLDIFSSKTGDKLHTFVVAGKNVSRPRIRRNTVDVVII